MASALHTELKALVVSYAANTLSDEEWALLQVHMAYCNACRRQVLRAERERKARDLAEGLSTACSA